jgi:RNA polymerase sigma factor (sigma-70 family)
MLIEIEGNVEQLYKAIRRLAMQIMPDRVDDLTQDVALSLWSKRSRLPAMVLLSYLRSTVRNASYDLLRRERRQKIWVDAIAINENGSISTMKEPQRQFYVSEPTSEYLEGTERVSQVCEAMKKLSSEQNEVLSLRAAGCSYADIAERQCISVATVRTRIHYARKRLEQVLGE